MITFTSIASSSKGNAYLVEAHGAAPLLLEAGLPISKLREALNFGLTGLAGCLASHCHGDHSIAIPKLLAAGVDVYVSAETAATLGIQNHHRTNIIATGKQVQIGPWAVLPFSLAHDVPTLGFVISGSGDTLLFIPDTEYIENRFSGITILVVEANHAEDILSDNIVSGVIDSSVGRRVRRTHLSLEVVKDFILANDFTTLRQIHLIHLSSANSDEQRFKREIQELLGVPVYVC